MIFKRVPFIGRAAYRELLEKAIRDDSGCLLYPCQAVTLSYKGKKRRVPAARLVWAETFGDRGLEDHEVTHVSACLHPSNAKDAMAPVCIEPTHLHLGTASDRNTAPVLRGTARRARCEHAERTAAGKCRVCIRNNNKRYRDKKRDQKKSAGSVSRLRTGKTPDGRSGTDGV